MLEIISEYSKNGRKYCSCQCDCGNIFDARKDNVKNGHTTSCGCRSSRIGKNLLGLSFGHLQVIEKTDKRNSAGSIIWKCSCDCSKHSIVEVDTHSLLSGATQSCGCLISKGEEVIGQLLSQNNIPFEKQKTFNDCKYPDTGYPPKFDFFVNNSYIIEFDGIQHYQQVSFFNQQHSLYDLQEKDKFKTEWCRQHHIPLIRISYTKLSTLTIQDLLLEEE